jgi:hypothetical protein
MVKIGLFGENGDKMLTVVNIIKDFNLFLNISLLKDVI